MQRKPNSLTQSIANVLTEQSTLTEGKYTPNEKVKKILADIKSFNDELKNTEKEIIKLKKKTAAIDMKLIKAEDTFWDAVYSDPGYNSGDDSYNAAASKLFHNAVK